MPQPLSPQRRYFDPATNTLHITDGSFAQIAAVAPGKILIEDPFRAGPNGKIENLPEEGFYPVSEVARREGYDTDPQHVCFSESRTIEVGSFCLAHDSNADLTVIERLVDHTQGGMARALGDAGYMATIARFEAAAEAERIARYRAAGLGAAYAENTNVFFMDATEAQAGFARSLASTYHFDMDDEAAALAVRLPAL